MNKKLRTYYNWLLRYKNYGIRNSFILKMNLKRDVCFAINYNHKNFFLRGNTIDFAVFQSIMVKGEYEFHLDFYPQYILDAGANIGASTCYFRIKYPQARIIAIEPEQSNYELLVRNLSPYKQIICVLGGIWGEDTKLYIQNPDADKYAFRVEEGDNGSYTINAYRIDTIMKIYNMPYIDILKMDIEGAELSVLSNDPLVWLSKVRVLIIELHENIKAGITSVFYEALSQIDYEKVIKGENLVITNKSFHKNLKLNTIK